MTTREQLLTFRNVYFVTDPAVSPCPPPRPPFVRFSHQMPRFVDTPAGFVLLPQTGQVLCVVDGEIRLHLPLIAELREFVCPVGVLSRSHFCGALRIQIRRRGPLPGRRGLLCQTLFLLQTTTFCLCAVTKSNPSHGSGYMTHGTPLPPPLLLPTSPPPPPLLTSPP